MARKGRSGSGSASEKQRTGGNEAGMADVSAAGGDDGGIGTGGSRDGNSKNAN